jgi:hypothetical protein
MSFLLDALPDDERRLLQQAAQCPGFPDWRDLTAAALAEVARARGPDFAVALLYDRLRRSPEHGPFIDAMEGPERPLPSLKGTTVAVAPGAFWKEYPWTGAGGEVVIEHARRAGMRAERVPLGSFPRLADNARTLADWLRRCPGEVILVTLSKATAEVRVALADPHLAPAFDRVRAWVSLSGLPFGTLLADWLLGRPLRCLGARLLLWWHGHRFAALRELAHEVPGPLRDGPLVVPPGMMALHVIGFPLARHLSRPLARRGTKRTAAWGPSDGGAFLLADVGRLGGLIYPVWGCDHYLEPAWDVGRLVRSFLRYTATACGACKEEEAPA